LLSGNFIEVVVGGALVWVILSMVVAISMALIALPALAFNCYKLIFGYGYFIVLVVFTVCYLYAIIKTTINSKENE
jgi:hypothetical protein